ncbi:CDP-alcohol phosphatidyltransferase family protein [bacterium]|nr:CDP-alcohol phosphatidyltransferase family protein [bacterium]
MYFVIVTCCTLFNMFLGLLALYLAITGSLFWACWALLASVCFDACDGFLARKLNVASEFGAQLDSLADYASFCLAGGVLGYAWAGASWGDGFSLASWAGKGYSSSLMGVIKALYEGGWRTGADLPHLQGCWHYCLLLVAFYFICFGGMRLARYNANTDSLCPPSFFEGLPTTGAAAILAILCLADFFAPTCCKFMNIYGIAIITVILGSLMFCRLPYPKLTKMSWIPKWSFALPLVVALFSVPFSAWFFCGLYLLSGPFYYFKNKV